MEPHLEHTHGRHFDDVSATHNASLDTVPEGRSYNEEDDQHHHGEKKSVIKKVKAKAKKLKDTITKHGHGHGHNHDHDHDHHEEEDDDDEEMEEDPEVHGAPMYDSATVGSRLGGTDAVMDHPRGNLERPSVMAEDRYTGHSDIVDPPARPFSQWQEEEMRGVPPPLPIGIPPEGVHHHAHGLETGMAEDPYPRHSDIVDPPVKPWQNSGTGGREAEVKIGQSTGMVEDPHSPKGPTSRVSPSNYETKVTDPTHEGGHETGITPILKSFGKMGIHDDEKSGQEEYYSGSHDQFAPEPVPKRLDPDHPEDLPRDTATGNPSSYTGKIASATSAIADKAAAAKFAVASKLGYSSQDDSTSAGGSAKEYAQKIASTVTETLAPVYDKVVDKGSSVVSKMQGSGSGSEQEIQRGEGGEHEGRVLKSDKGVVGVKGYLSETFAPRDEDKALSEVITHAFRRGGDGDGDESEKKSGEDRPPVERVTESAEVQKRLSSGKDEEDSSRHVRADKGVVDRLKGAVGSWFGSKGNVPQGSMGTSYVTDEGLSSSAGGGDEKVKDGGRIGEPWAR